MMLSMVLFTNHANARKVHVEEESDHVSTSSDSRGPRTESLVCVVGSDDGGSDDGATDDVGILVGVPRNAVGVVVGAAIGAVGVVVGAAVGAVGVVVGAAVGTALGGGVGICVGGAVGA